MFERKPWNAEPKHNWPDGKYIGATCSECGVSGFMHHKNGPALCYPHWLEGQTREAERKARWMDDMVGEYGPYVPPPTFTVTWFHSATPPINWEKRRRELIDWRIIEPCSPKG